MGSGITRYQEQKHLKFSSHEYFLEYINENGARYTNEVAKRVNTQPNNVIHTVIFYSHQLSNYIVTSGIKKMFE